jgi:hypothetical protein
VTWRRSEGAARRGAGRKVGARLQSATFPTKAAGQRWAVRLAAAIDDGRSRGGRAAQGTVGERAIAGFGKSKTSPLGLVKAGLGRVRLIHRKACLASQ